MHIATPFMSKERNFELCYKKWNGNSNVGGECDPKILEAEACDIKVNISRVAEGLVMQVMV